MKICICYQIVGFGMVEGRLILFMMYFQFGVWFMVSVQIYVLNKELVDRGFVGYQVGWSIV